MRSTAFFTVLAAAATAMAVDYRRLVVPPSDVDLETFCVDWLSSCQSYTGLEEPSYVCRDGTTFAGCEGTAVVKCVIPPSQDVTAEVVAEAGATLTTSC